jgi:hypothetical protein
MLRIGNKIAPVVYLLKSPFPKGRGMGIGGTLQPPSLFFAVNKSFAVGKIVIIPSLCEIFDIGQKTWAVSESVMASCDNHLIFLFGPR